MNTPIELKRNGKTNRSCT